MAREHTRGAAVHREEGAQDARLGAQVAIGSAVFLERGLFLVFFAAHEALERACIAAVGVIQSNGSRQKRARQQLSTAAGVISGRGGQRCALAEVELNEPAGQRLVDTALQFQA